MNDPVAELTRLVLQLQSEIIALRTEMSTAIQTGALVIDDGSQLVRVTPGEIIVERRAITTDPQSGSSVHIRSLLRGAEVMVEAASTDDEFGMAATINANWEDAAPVAILSVQGGPVLGQDSLREIRVHDGSALSER